MIPKGLLISWPSLTPHGRSLLPWVQLWDASWVEWSLEGVPTPPRDLLLLRTCKERKVLKMDLVQGDHFSLKCSYPPGTRVSYTLETTSHRKGTITTKTLEGIVVWFDQEKVGVTHPTAPGRCLTIPISSILEVIGVRKALLDSRLPEWEELSDAEKLDHLDLLRSLPLKGVGEGKEGDTPKKRVSRKKGKGKASPKKRQTPLQAAISAMTPEKLSKLKELLNEPNR